MKLMIPVEHSLQNPTYGPQGQILLTRFRGGYNEPPADLYVFESGHARCITTGPLDGKCNVSQPGLSSCWHPTGVIAFSTTYGGDDDWPYLMRSDGTELRPATPRQDGFMGYEPSLAPDGVTVVFERHRSGQEKSGQICVRDRVLSEGDSRQPSWSPDGKSIVWQRQDGGRWTLVLFDVGTGIKRDLTARGDDYTDATWHPNSGSVLCSGERGLYVVSVVSGSAPARLTETDGYMGAPSYSFDGRRVVCEAYGTDEPDGSRGTWIEEIAL